MAEASTSSLKQSTKRPTARSPRPTQSPLTPAREIDLERWQRPLAITLLTILTVVAFAGSLFAGYINYDDARYLGDNPYMARGLTVDGVRWAFTHTLVVWHPLSFLSFMLDQQLFGISPMLEHAENLLFHVLNVLLAFWLLRVMTGSTWRSAAVAALFAVHPMRVESVVWVSERKDVLSLFFGLAALLFYAWYARRPTVTRYLPIIPLLALSLLAKATFIVFPALMLLLNWWPLQRIETRSWRRLAVELLPVVLLVAVFYAIFRRFGDAGNGLYDDIPVQHFAPRLANALVCWFRYVWLTIWPIDLAIPYPLRHWAGSQVVASTLFLLATTAAVCWQWRARPWLAVGWLWFLITLLPVIGIVAQVAFHSMADRYSYLPCIGLFVMLVWSLPDPHTLAPRARQIFFIASATTLIVLVTLTRIQTAYWQDSITLFQHSVAVTGVNDFAEYSLGVAYFSDAHDIDAAIVHYQRAVDENPQLASARDNLGFLLNLKGRTREAIQQFQIASHIAPHAAEVHNNWAAALFGQGDLAGAADQFRAALALNPSYREARIGLAICLQRSGKPDDALAALRPLLNAAVPDPDAHFVAAQCREMRQRWPEAAEDYQLVTRLNPSFADAHLALATLLETHLKNRARAAAEYRQTLRLRPGDGAALAGLQRLSH